MACCVQMALAICNTYVQSLNMEHNFKNLTVRPPLPGPADWNETGVVILPDFIPENILQAYEECWERENADRPGGWPDCTPYRRHTELFNLCTYGPLGDELKHLIGEPAAVHLNLTPWISTERDWHQDSYLNPPHVGDYYAAVWVSLEQINPESGPFQYVPGSHRWRQVTRAKILNALPPEQRDHRWPKYSEQVLTPIFTQEIKNANAQIITHLPNRGDVLIWHGRLLHRGSPAEVKGAQRKAIIAHYSGINHRPDMPQARQSPNGGWYFPIDDQIQYDG